MARILPSSLLLLLLAVVPIVAPVDASAQSGRQPVEANNGMVVSTQYLASDIGREILMQGGNAVDAAVATAFALAVVHPAAGNIGGGGFLVYHGADGEATAFNFREKAPMAATQRMYVDEAGEYLYDKHHNSIFAVGVPGTVAGLELAHQRLGSLPWADLVEPAIRLAEDGFPFTRNLRDAQQMFKRLAEEDPIHQPAADAFLKNGTDFHEPGELLVQPDLAETLKRIRRDGKDGFYSGETADLIVDFMEKHGGLITHEDLAAYGAVEQPPIHGTYRGYDIYAMSPPSSGGIALVTMLNILEGFELAEYGHNSAMYLHILTEAMRRAYADRAQHVGDPEFNPDMPVERLTSKQHADELRSSIDLFRASESDSARFNATYESEETTHFSVVDAEGNMVSMTYTLEYSYGSRILVEGGGFLLNNEMGDFNPVPGRTTRGGLIGTDPNLLEPEKRMLSSMTPSIVARDRRPVLAVGSPGGRTIINTVLQVILNMVDFDMNVAEAVEAPRIHHQWLPDETDFERGLFSPDTERLYSNMGHSIDYRGSQGRAMCIWIDHEDGVLYGAADSRSYKGKASGY